LLGVGTLSPALVFGAGFWLGIFNRVLIYFLKVSCGLKNKIKV